jgi:hypothetical protein
MSANPAIAILLMLWILPSDALGQAPPPPPPPSPLFGPARDTTPNPKGTAVIKGHVIRADTRQPLRRAQVRVTGGSLRQPVIAGTNARGAYEIRDLPAGRYTVTTTRTGYLTLQNGQRYPGEAGTPIELPNGAEVEIDFAMPRAGVVAGRITDETGDVVAQVAVWLLQPRWFEGQRRLVPVGGRGLSDDAGEYRVTGLGPGEYIVMATLHETWTDRVPEPVVLGYAPTYHPSTTNVAEAVRVQVGLGQELDAVDVALVPGRTATVSGVALLADGTPLAGATLSLGQRMDGPGSLSRLTRGNSRVGPDGSWVFRNVPPGEYEISLVSVALEPRLRTQMAMLPVVVHGADLTDLLLTPAVGVTVAGTIRTDDGSPLPAVAQLRVQTQRLGRGPQGASPGAVNADGTFSAANVPPGATLLRLSQLPADWGIRSIIVHGREHADVPFDVRSGQDVEKIQIVISRGLAAVMGRTVDEQGEAVHATVLLFPADPARWQPDGDTMRHARPDQHGTFRLEHVRPGEYLVVALDYVQTWQVTDPEFLESVRRRATKVQVVDGEPEPVTLRVLR